MSKLLGIVPLVMGLLLACSGSPPPVGTVVDRLSGAPIAGAEVELGGERVLTDGAGRFVLALGDEGRLRVSAPGFLTLERELEPGLVVRLFPAVTTPGEDERLSARRQAERARLALPEADLRDLARAIEARLAAGPLRVADVVSHAPRALVAVPESIRVWRRRVDGSTASCSGRVDVIPFDTYVKGVLPHEWIPSWDPLALEMGAVAIRTYAAAWIAAGGKYDCADLDDTAASQVYEDETLPRTDAAVDATAGVVVVQDGSLVFAEYSAENGDPTAFDVAEPHCTGEELFGHGRGTCQWGTQRWAKNEGKDFVWMTAHYYPGASAQLLVPAEPDAGPLPPDAAPESPPDAAPPAPDAAPAAEVEVTFGGGCGCRAGGANDPVGRVLGAAIGVVSFALLLWRFLRRRRLRRDRDNE